jgi:hypothetical protein
MRSKLTVLLSLVFAAGSAFVASEASAQEVGATAASKQAQEDPDMGDPDQIPPQKSWSVGAGFESNRSIKQEDVGGRIKSFNTASLNGGYQFGRNDRVAVFGGVIQRFIADPTETGVRADDIVLSYSHTFRLPAEINIGASVSDALPISYYSQLMSLIALPHASLSVSRGFLDHTLDLSIRGGASYYVVKYKEADGFAAPNPRASTDIGFNIHYAFPLHRQLQFDAGASTGWSWSYNPDHSNDPVLAAQFANAKIYPTADQYFAGNPPGQQRYGGSVAVSYDLPMVVGVGSTVQVQVSQGDGIYRDGATHLYWLSRRGGMMSAAISANY